MLNCLMRFVYIPNHYRDIVYSMSKNESTVYLTEQLNDEAAVDVY